MKTLLVATFVDFWAGGSGHRSRISSLLEYLQHRVRITVFFAGRLSDADRNLLRERFGDVAVESAGMDGPLTYGEYAERFSHFIRDRTFDFALVEYIELSAVLEYLPEHTVSLLDTHDLVADRIRSFKKMGLPYDGIDLTFEEELDIFRCYDYVVLIQQNDLESVARWIDPDRLVLTPHPVPATPGRIRKQVQNIGFVASPYLPNVEALGWFLQHVWGPTCEGHALTLNVYGNIRDEFPVPEGCHVRWHGFVADEEQVYRDSDILINPVRCGAGLKIKNVEALAHGLPLVTTTHGATGMEDGAARCFLQADDAGAFASAIRRLIGDRGLRETLARNAVAYARTHFSTEGCYGAIARLIT
jgi:glycosyltransferase involved in cell wall biosynthesis